MNGSGGEVKGITVLKDVTRARARQMYGDRMQVITIDHLMTELSSLMVLTGTWPTDGKASF